MNRRMIQNVIAMAAVSMLAAACGSSASGGGESYTIRMASTATPEHTYTPEAEAMAKKVEERSDGRLKVELVFGGVLGSEKEMTEQVQRGEVEMGWLSDIGMAGVVPDIGFVNLPYLFPSYEEVDKNYFGGFLGEEVKARLAKHDIKLLGWVENDYRDLTNSTKEIDSVDDLKGLKLRVPELPMFVDFFSKLGANPTPIAVTELLTALQQGTVDGQDNGVILTYSFGFYEAQKYFTDTHHSYSGGGIVIGAQTWNDLPEDLQTILAAGSEAAGVRQRAANRDQVASFRQKMVDSGIKFTKLSEAERARFVDVGRSLYPEYADDYGSELMQKIDDELGND